MAMNGTDLLVLVNTGSEAVPVYEVVGCQRDVTFDETVDLIDVSCKEERAKRSLPGRSGSTISLDALYLPDDARYAVLKNATREGLRILIAREEYGVVTETALAWITSLSEAFPDQGAATVSIGMEVSGAWIPVGS